MHWFIFVLLCAIWGSSFILMKEGLTSLTAYQVAAIRIISAGAALVPFIYKSFKAIPKDKLLYVILSGILGNFIPAFLFCIAETKIDSSLAGILNSLTTFFAIIVGALFYGVFTNFQKIIGVLIGFAGMILLFTGNGKIDFKNIQFSSLIVIATILYAINLNMVGKHLKGINSLHTATIAFAFLIIPSLIILFFTDFQSIHFSKEVVWSITASSILGVFGTAVATTLYYMLIKRTGILFSSLISYGIPFVAVLWGLLLDEKVTFIQIISLAIILLGVYITNTSKNYFLIRKGTAQ